jgi:hypothetical protein
VNLQPYPAATYPPSPYGPHVQRSSLRGLGQTPSTAGTAAVIAQSGATVTTGILSSLQAAAAGSSLAGPIGLAITGAITLGVALYNVFKGCGETCTEATSYVQQIGPILTQNLANYLAAPIHTASLQAAALNNFDTAMNALLAACGQAALGQAGQHCVEAFEQGACVYKTSPGGWQQDAQGNWSYQYPGANGSGQTCWNFYVGFRDPIANDPTVVPDSVITSTSTTGTSTTGTPSGGAVPNPAGSSAGAVASGAQSSLPVPLILLGGGLLLLLAAME